jgi:hypothetical protein
MLRDVPVLWASLAGIGLHKDLLRKGRLLPVGSVEFMRGAMAQAGVQEPAAPGYPAALAPWFFREVRRSLAGGVIGEAFVKPVTTKAFTGFVFDTMRAPDAYSEHDREQYAAFMSMDASTEIWTSDVVRFDSEHRYYVHGGKILGSGCYAPDSDEPVPTPDPGQVQAAVDALGWSHPYALDMGVLHTGETALVEVNAAWAIGLYGKAISPRDFLTYLGAGWAHVLEQSTTVTTT